MSTTERWVVSVAIALAMGGCAVLDAYTKGSAILDLETENEIRRILSETISAKP